jgi:hypothetical protein
MAYCRMERLSAALCTFRLEQAYGDIPMDQLQGLGVRPDVV